MTGSNRGIGYGLIEHLLREPNSMVIATCRSPSTTTVFDHLKHQYGDRLVVMMLDVTSEWSFEVLKGQLVEKAITYIDVLIANAGIAGERDSFHECELDNFNSVFSTNVFGPMLTYQNLSQLVLQGSSRIFVTISSTMGSITKTGEGYPQRTTSYSVPKACASYRMSKSTVNMLSMILSRDPDIQAAGCKVLCINPGWVQTDMGSAGGRTATFSVEECSANIINILRRTIAIQENVPPAPSASSSTKPAAVLDTVFTAGEDIQDKDARASTNMQEFEQVIGQGGSNCVFVNYDGTVIPW